jgi:signal transduction histidine kinase
LGLYIAKGLVEAHGGHIWAESMPGELTRFAFAIPLDGPTLPASASSAS